MRARPPSPACWPRARSQRRIFTARRSQLPPLAAALPTCFTRLGLSADSGGGTGIHRACARAAAGGGGGLCAACACAAALPVCAAERRRGRQRGARVRPARHRSRPAPRRLRLCSAQDHAGLTGGRGGGRRPPGVLGPRVLAAGALAGPSAPGESSRRGQHGDPRCRRPSSLHLVRVLAELNLLVWTRRPCVQRCRVGPTKACCNV